MSNRAKIFIGLVTAVLWLTAIAGIHWFPDVKEPLLAFIGLCQAVVIGLGATHIATAGRDGGEAATAVFAPAAEAPRLPGQQTGFVAWSFYWWLMPIALGAALLGGCTTTTATLAASYETAAKRGIMAADDNMRQAIFDIICAQPVGSVVRDARFSELAQIACRPNAGSVDPAAALLSGSARTLTLQLLAPAPAASAPKP